MRGDVKRGRRNLVSQKKFDNSKLLIKQDEIALINSIRKKLKSCSENIISRMYFVRSTGWNISRMERLNRSERHISLD